MKEDIYISINPLVEFVSGTDGKKRRIIKQQKQPIKFMVAYYRVARSRMKKFIENDFSIDEIVNGINQLQGKKATTKFQINDKNNSIEALRKFLELQFPNDFTNMKFKFLKVKDKDLNVDGVNIRIAPDTILEFERNGKKHFGGVKFHISRSFLFDSKSGAIVSTGIKLYLEEKVANGSYVDPDFCVSIDVFGGRITKAPHNHEKSFRIIRDACEEVVELWNVS